METFDFKYASLLEEQIWILPIFLTFVFLNPPGTSSRKVNSFKGESSCFYIIFSRVLWFRVIPWFRASLCWWRVLEYLEVQLIFVYFYLCILSRLNVKPLPLESVYFEGQKKSYSDFVSFSDLNIINIQLKINLEKKYNFNNKAINININHKHILTFKKP